MSALTVAPPAQTNNPSPTRVASHLYACRAADPAQAPLIRHLAEIDTEVLPRWHQEDRGWRNRHRGYHEQAPDGAYKQIPVWRGRDHWLMVVVPTAIALARAKGESPPIATQTMLTWAKCESLYAQDQRTGRRVIVRPATLAGVMGKDKRTVQRCRRWAKTLGLLVDVAAGRMLNLVECLAARLRGSRQRGLSTESALTIPTHIVLSTSFVTPTRGSSRVDQISRGTGLTYSAASGTDTTETASPPRPSKRRRPRRNSQAVRLARRVQSRVPWLASEPLAALIPTLHRFAVSEPAWAAQDITDAIDTITVRLGWTAIHGDRIRTRPAAVLAWYLRQVDVHADHPRMDAFATGTAIEQRPHWCGQCDRRTRQVQLDVATMARCRRCHPLASR